MTEKLPPDVTRLCGEFVIAAANLIEDAKVLERVTNDLLVEAVKAKMDQEGIGDLMDGVRHVGKFAGQMRGLEPALKQMRAMLDEMRAE